MSANPHIEKRSEVKPKGGKGSLGISKVILAEQKAHRELLADFQSVGPVDCMERANKMREVIRKHFPAARKTLDSLGF